MPEEPDRNPYHFIPLEFQERSKLWIAAAKRLLGEADPFIPMSIENLMFAEPLILKMESSLARQDAERPNAVEEPWLLVECTAHSMMWVCGLYEVTRGLRAKNSPNFPAVRDLHNKLQLLRIPLAKHEVTSAPGYRETSHYPTSIWSAETGRVGWHVFNPATKTLEPQFRTDLADEFLGAMR